MATPITWKFVDQPIASPTVLLDMNDGTTMRVERPGPQCPTPALRQSFAANAMNNGAVLASESYENRQLKWTVWLNGASPTAKISQLDALKAQLSKPSNLIMYNPPGWGFPIFFRTVGSGDYQVDNRGGANGEWHVTCTAIAEPYAIGIRRDLSTVTVTNDPATGTNPARWDITGILGDSPTPAFVRVAGLGAGGSLILAQRTVNSPTAVTTFAQLEAGTLGTDTATWSNAVMSGGNGIATSFATDATLITRATVTVPTASSADALRGRYRVLVRAHSASTGAVFSLRYQQAAGGDVYSGPTVTWQAASTTPWYLVDLGLLEFPAFAAPRSIGYSGLAAGYATSALAIQAARTAGSANLDLDYVYLVPADERWCTVSQVGAVGYLVLDGPNDATYGMASGSSPFSATLSSRTVDNASGLTPRFGGLPQLVPGATNRWHMLLDAQTITTTKTVDVSYWPRWREVATA